MHALPTFDRLSRSVPSKKSGNSEITYVKVWQLRARRYLFLPDDFRGGALSPPPAMLARIPVSA